MISQSSIKKYALHEWSQVIHLLTSFPGSNDTSVTISKKETGFEVEVTKDKDSEKWPKKSVKVPLSHVGLFDLYW